MIKLTVIIPTKDRHPVLLRTLESIIIASKIVTSEILIIDNSTTSEIILPETLTDSRINIFKNPGDRNSVFSSRNFGASIAKNEILLFLDDDIIVTKEAIEKVIFFHKAYKSSCLNIDWVYPKDLIEKMKKTIFGRYIIRKGFSRMRDLMGTERWKPNLLYNSGEVASYFFSIEREDFKKFGGYEERHLHEGTDEDLVKRLNEAGIKMYIDTTTHVYHNESDRLFIKNWMERKERFGEISAFAEKNFKLANTPLKYSLAKRLFFEMIYKFRLSLFWTLRNFYQDSLLFDKFFFKIIDFLLGAHICHGYNKK